MGILLSLAAAITYGCSDFLGGMVTRKVNVLVVVLASQVLGSTVLVAALLLFTHESPTASALWWGAGAGVAGTIGVVLLYRGLADGRMSIVAPVTAVEAACVPVLFGVLVGERPSVLAVIGVATAIPSVALVSSSQDPQEALDGSVSGRSLLTRLRGNGIPQAVGAGLCFGAFFILVQRAGPSGGLWPLASVRIVSILMMVVAVVVVRPSLKEAGANLVTLAVVGGLDVTANVFFVLATQRTLLSIAAVLTSLYPAITVLLATAILKERLRRVQLVGLTAAVVGIALISLG
ncbi:MAG: DMT family transporter [Actinomycetota bacterium]|nr:DMT family transporter [Actinomycetota bacterium]